MKKFFTTFLFGLAIIISSAQSPQIIDEKEVERIETELSANNMQGRKVFTTGSEKAADFISTEFKKIGLETLKGANSYKQVFDVVSSKVKSISASFNGKPFDPKKLIVFTCQPDLSITSRSDFKKINLRESSEFSKRFSEFVSLKENLIVFVDPLLAKNFNRLATRKLYLFKSDKSIVFVLGSFADDEFVIKAKHEIAEEQASNVVGILPGKSKKNEFVIFSAHYDHIGIGESINNDSIYNGANDDASGVTAVISLANYYKASKNNERTLIFAAFTAEEIGGYGSQYFSSRFDPDKVVAMINIEMIGTESKWGKNSAYITGFEHSNLGNILQKNLIGSDFAFFPDPYPEQDLFFRSDNATLARSGVPAHTISTSKMDNEVNYHKVTDEVKTLDINNMTQIIQAITISAQSIINGRDTPTRVNANELKR